MTKTTDELKLGMPDEIWVMKIKGEYCAVDKINEGTIDDLSTKYTRTPSITVEELEGMKFDKISTVSTGQAGEDRGWNAALQAVIERIK